MDFTSGEGGKRNDYLSLSEVFHKTFLSLDEQGTEAAAATVSLGVGWGVEDAPKEKPKEIFVDHPFIFAY